MSTDRFPIGIHFLTYGANWSEIVPAVQSIDRLGYDGIYMHDHLYATQGDFFQPFFEAFTTIAAFAGLTHRVRLGHLTGANTFRNPGVVARMVTTIDHVSRGRAVLGMGAAWEEEEQRAHGIDLGRSLGQRLDWLDESLAIMRALLAGEEVNHQSEKYRFDHVRHEPRPLQAHVPILMGSSGEKKGLRIVARHADFWQTWGGLDDPSEFVRLCGVLERHCGEVGRDPTTIKRWPGIKLIVRSTPEAAADAWEAMARFHGWSPEIRAYLAPMAWVGTPASIADGLRRYRGHGADGLIVTAMAPYDYETLERLVGEVAPLAGVS